MSNKTRTDKYKIPPTFTFTEAKAFAAKVSATLKADDFDDRWVAFRDDDSGMTGVVQNAFSLDRNGWVFVFCEHAMPLLFPDSINSYAAMLKPVYEPYPYDFHRVKKKTSTKRGK